MKISFYCDIKSLNWQVITELPSVLLKNELKVGGIEAVFRRFPESVTLHSMEELSGDIDRKGPPKRFYLNLSGPEGKENFSLVLLKDLNIHAEPYLTVSLESRNPEATLQSVMRFLGLRPEEPEAIACESPRTAFIAHRFDQAGDVAAGKIARFLSLLGFDCLTGQGYEPRSVADKVKSRIMAQAIIIVVLTPGEENTWLIQESLLSSSAGKPLILIRDTTAGFKPGLLADHEFIPICAGCVEQAFIPLLEGLRNVGYRF